MQRLIQGSEAIYGYSFPILCGLVGSGRNLKAVLQISKLSRCRMHGRRKRGYAGDLTPPTIHVEGILICISPVEKKIPTVIVMQTVSNT